MNRVIFEDNKRAWDDLGRGDPFWSVLSKFKTAEMTDKDVDAFYATGKHSVDMVRGFLRRSYTDFPGGRCLDYGCGLGRVAFELTDIFESVVGVDISPSHLELARTAAERLQKNVDFVELDGIGRLNAIGKFDFIHSFLVLQHIHPDLVRLILERFGAILNPGGIGFIQLPTYHPAYEPEKVLLAGKPLSPGEFQLFALPTRDVINILVAQGCEILGVHDCDTVGADWDSKAFVFRKKKRRFRLI